MVEGGSSGGVYGRNGGREREGAYSGGVYCRHGGRERGRGVRQRWWGRERERCTAKMVGEREQ